MFSSPVAIPHHPIKWVRGEDYYPCTSEGWFPHPTDCTLFYRCVRLTYLADDYYLSYIFECPPGTYFDGKTEVCYHVANFFGCGIFKYASNNADMLQKIFLIFTKLQITSHLPRPILMKKNFQNISASNRLNTEIETRINPEKIQL